MQSNFLARLWQTLRDISCWLRPGLSIKRWFTLVIIGITLLGLGFAVILIDLYRKNTHPCVILKHKLLNA